MLDFPLFKRLSVLAVILLGIWYAIPNFFDKETRLNSAIADNAVRLGLDLQGGSYLLLNVDVESYLKERYQFAEDDVRSLLREQRVRYQQLNATDTSVQVTLPNDGAEVLEKLKNEFDITNEGTRFTLTYTPELQKEMQQNVVEQSMEIVRRRVDQTGTTEPIIQRQGEQRILLQVPGLKDPGQLKRLLGTTAKMTFHLAHPNNFTFSNKRAAEPGYIMVPSRDGSEYYQLNKRIELDGQDLVNAVATFQSSVDPVISFSMNNQGARKFAKITQEHVGEPFAIVLDNQVITAPVIRSPILNGSGIIEGNFTVEEARETAMLLRAGALPAPLTVPEERSVGPSLGQDSIAAGKAAALIGFLAVVVFMLLSYGVFGIISNIALVVNLVLMLAALSLLGATLTLPGIAGIVLTMGIAVDANVLIFERIREESRSGKSAAAAVDQGFRQAFKTILDSNLTTLIATLILFTFGAGPVKGFAVTLSIGILCSMFSAIMFTRLLVIYWLKWQKPKHVFA